MAENFCNGENLIYDEACVFLKKDADFSDAWLYSLSSDCHLCPFTRVAQISDRQNQSLKFSIARWLTWRIRSDGIDDYVSASNKSEVICEFIPALRQFGVYELYVGNGSCDLTTLKNPSSLYAPLFVIFGVILCVLAGCSLIGTGVKVIKRKLRDENVVEDVEDKATKSGKRRVKSIDTFRGISILMMIFVNDGAGGYWILEHATWDGILIGDFVFPWFMWIMGVCLPISVGSQLSKNSSRFSLSQGVLKRSVILFILGVALNTLGTNAQLETIRIFGVLQRFSVAYLIVALILVFLSRRKRIEPKNSFLKIIKDIIVIIPEWILILFIVAVHSAITFHLPVPGCPKGYLGPGGRHDDGKYSGCVGGATGYIDKKLLGVDHIYKFPTTDAVYGSGPFDPEGIVGCLTSVFQVFLGVQAGMILRYYKSWSSRVCRWLAWAAICGFLGAFLHFTGFVPINKNLWSTSFVLVTTSLAFLLLTFCYLLVDVLRIWRGGPFRIPGMNALAMYVGHQISYQIFPFHWAFGRMDTHAWRLVETVWGVSLWTIVAYVLHRKKVYIAL